MTDNEDSVDRDVEIEGEESRVVPRSQRNDEGDGTPALTWGGREATLGRERGARGGDPASLWGHSCALSVA